MFIPFPKEVFERYSIRTTIVRMFQKPSRIITNAAVAFSQILFPNIPKMSQTKQLKIPTKLHKLTIKSVIVFSLLYSDVCRTILDFNFGFVIFVSEITTMLGTVNVPACLVVRIEQIRRSHILLFQFLVFFVFVFIENVILAAQKTESKSTSNTSTNMNDSIQDRICIFVLPYQRIDGAENHCDKCNKSEKDNDVFHY